MRALVKKAAFQFGILMLLLSGLQVFASESLRLQYGRLVPSWQRDLLDGDLRLLGQVNWQDSDGELARVFGLHETNGKNLEAWLQQRARYIVDERFDTPSKSLVVLAPKVVYVLASDLTPIDSYKNKKTIDNLSKTLRARAIDNSRKNSNLQVSTTGKVMMANVTSRIFPYFRYKNAFMGVKIDGVGVVAIDSSQVGIFRVGEGLFGYSKLEQGTDPRRNFANRIRRLRTLVHESRHGDGNGDSGTFPHIQCPEGHELEGLYACDESANGPYRVAALLMQSALEGCQADGSCPVEQAEIMKLVLASDLSRILSTLKIMGIDGKEVQPLEYDPTPEIVEAIK